MNEAICILKIFSLCWYIVFVQPNEVVKKCIILLKMRSLGNTHLIFITPQDYNGKHNMVSDVRCLLFVSTCLFIFCHFYYIYPYIASEAVYELSVLVLEEVDPQMRL